MDFLMVMENSFGMMELFKKEDGKKVISKDQAEIQKCLIIYQDYYNIYT